VKAFPPKLEALNVVPAPRLMLAPAAVKLTEKLSMAKVSRLLLPVEAPKATIRTHTSDWLLRAETAVVLKAVVPKTAGSV